MKASKARLAATAVMGLLALGVAACDSSKAVYPTKERGDSTPRMSNEPRETIFGDEGLLGGKNKKQDGSAAGIGVNSFLWRASLDTIGFLPIATADPFGGTIITDWYQMPEAPNERVKMNIFILDRALRADGVKVTVFKQMRDTSGNWIDMRVDPKTAADVEDTILTRARQLRIVSTE